MSSPSPNAATCKTKFQLHGRASEATWRPAPARCPRLFPSAPAPRKPCVFRLCAKIAVPFRPSAPLLFLCPACLANAA